MKWKFFNMALLSDPPLHSHVLRPLVSLAFLWFLELEMAVSWRWCCRCPWGLCRCWESQGLGFKKPFGKQEWRPCFCWSWGTYSDVRHSDDHNLSKERDREIYLLWPSLITGKSFQIFLTIDLPSLRFAIPICTVCVVWQFPSCEIYLKWSHCTLVFLVEANANPSFVNLGLLESWIENSSIRAFTNHNYKRHRETSNHECESAEIITELEYQDLQV